MRLMLFFAFTPDPIGSAVPSAAAILGAGFALLLMIAALIGCVSGMRNRRTSRKSLLALMSVACAWLGGFAGLLAIHSMGPQPGVVATGLLGVVCLGTFALIVAGAALGIAGVVDTFQQPERYRHGRKRGYAAIAIAGVYVILGLIGVAIQARGSRLAAMSPAAAGQTSANPIPVDEFNFQVTPPDRWLRVEPKRINPQACLAFMHSSPEMVTVVIAETMPSVAAVAPEQLAEVVKNHLRTAGLSQIDEEQKSRTNGLDGIRIESEGKAGFARMFFTHWIATFQNTGYQVVTWGPATARDAVRKESERFRETFQLLDRSREPAVPASMRANSTAESKPYGWTVDLRKTWWTRRWNTLAEDVPAAEWGVSNTAGTAWFCIVPVWIGRDEADLETVTQALLARIGIPYPDDAIFGVKENPNREQSLAQGRCVSWEGARGGSEILCRMRVLRTPVCSYLLAAWFDKKAESQMDLLDEALDRVRFNSQLPKPPDPWFFNPREQAVHRLVCNDIGLKLRQSQDFSGAAKWFKRGFEYGSSDPTLLLNYGMTALSLPRSEDAQAWLEKQMGKFPNNPRLAACLAQLQMKNNEVEKGLQTYAAVFDSGEADSAQLSTFVYAACEHGKADAALSVLNRCAAVRETPQLIKLRAMIYEYQRDWDKAIEALSGLRKTAPADTDAAWQLSECYMAAERYQECVAECDRIIEAHRESAAVYRRKGFAEVALKRYRDAKASLERAHDRDPADFDAKRMLDHVTAMLGQGAHVAVRKPLDPVAIPRELASAPAAERGGDYLHGFSAYYPSYIRAFRFERGRESKSTEQVSVRVLDQQGVENFSTLEFTFDPLSEEIFVNSLTVKNAAGETVSTAKVEDSYVVDDGAEEMATQRKVLHVPVAGLQPGSTIEYTVTRRETGEAKTFNYRAHSMARGLPILRSVCLLQAPAGSVKWEKSPGVTEKKLKDAVCWQVEQPQVYRVEPQQTWFDKVVPIVWLADAKASWPAEAKEYLDSIKERLAVEPAVKEAAAAAVKGLATEDEKIAALARLVQRDLTYKAIEFGRRARLPNPAAQTLRNRYGDCKDHSLLLCQMLNSAGVRAHLALVSTGNRTRSELPSLDQFNHVVVFVPSRKAEAFIDCTGKSADLSAALPPHGLATQQALILDPERPRLEAVPDFPPNSAAVRAEREVQVIDGADLDIREKLTFTGYMAASVRGSFERVQPADRKRILLQMLNAHTPSLELLDAEMGRIDEPQGPLTMELHYLVRQKLQPVGSWLVGQLPAPWERMLVAATPVEKRSTPFRIWFPTVFESVATIAAPPGWSAVRPEARKLDRPFCTGRLAADSDPNRRLRLTSRVEQKPGEYPAAQYAGFYRAMTESVSLFEQNIVFEKQ